MLEIKRLGSSPDTAGEVAAMMDASNIEFNEIACVNWPDKYPYKPEVKFRIAYTEDALVLHFKVKERTVAALASSDNGNVWEDSCVEFFLKPGETDDYFNIECNCAATILIAKGADRTDRKHLDMKVLEKVKRFSTLGRGEFKEKLAPEEWEVAYIVPLEILGLKDVKGREMAANFYKCGDNLSIPHFLSWSPIDTPSPDFHRPEYFAPIIFK